jgi:hypothetical protein
MAQRIENSCRTALVDALALLDGQGQHGAACYVAMAIDCLDEAALDAEAKSLAASQHSSVAARGPA